jgi:hypothetical protein
MGFFDGKPKPEGSGPDTTGPNDDKAGKKTTGDFVCVISCVYAGKRYHKGDKVTADKCPPHFEPARAEPPKTA